MRRGDRFPPVGWMVPRPASGTLLFKVMVGCVHNSAAGRLEKAKAVCTRTTVSVIFLVIFFYFGVQDTRIRM